MPKPQAQKKMIEQAKAAIEKNGAVAELKAQVATSQSKVRKKLLKNCLKSLKLN
jgi:hypothetical protein